MSIHESPPPPAEVAAARRLPPVAEVAVASMALVIVSGIYLAAHLPTRAPFGPAVGLVAAAGALLLGNLIVLSRLRQFAWTVFYRVAGWASLAYIVIGGMLEFIFIFDHTRGSMLVLLTLSLVIFAIDIPVLLAFSVARYQEPEPR
jgi:hypothetical protein